MYVVGQQKPAQHCKAIIELKINFLKKEKRTKAMLYLNSTLLLEEFDAG